MRSVFFGIIALSALCETGSQARVSTAIPIRAVQLIRLNAMSPVSSPAAAAGETPAVAGGNQIAALNDAVDGEAAFRVHDLSRRWVEFEMKESFQALWREGRSAVVEKDLLLQVDVARTDGTPSSRIRRLPQPIAIPAWMREGLAFSASAVSFVPQCSATSYRPAGFLSAAAESRRFAFYALMRNVACQYGIPTGLFDAMIIRESNYQPAVYSAKKAFGLTQLMPDTAIGLGVDRYDTVQNLRGGAKYLRQQLDRFGQVHLALAAYNAGPGRVRNGMVPRITETVAYVDNVLLNWQRLSGLATPAMSARFGSVPVNPPNALVRSASVSTYQASHNSRWTGD